ncbi:MULTISPECIES: hypothetical protein [Bradyrhizobium]|uniref:hypothetical protein n=1 Tax=Bradyrhizobium elkanii TaxID=29448 RepID=UPI00159F11E8|nr:hypothetical protein [Bradyrhizobium elkanii]
MNIFILKRALSTIAEIMTRHGISTMEYFMVERFRWARASVSLKRARYQRSHRDSGQMVDRAGTEIYLPAGLIRLQAGKIGSGRRGRHVSAALERLKEHTSRNDLSGIRLVNLVAMLPALLIAAIARLAATNDRAGDECHLAQTTAPSGSRKLK